MSRLEGLREWPFWSPEGTGRGARPLMSERLGRDEGGREADSIAEMRWRLEGFIGDERGRGSSGRCTRKLHTTVSAVRDYAL